MRHTSSSYRCLMSRSSEVHLLRLLTSAHQDQDAAAINASAGISGAGSANATSSAISPYENQPDRQQPSEPGVLLTC